MKEAQIVERKSEVVSFVGKSRKGKSLLMQAFVLDSHFAYPHQKWLLWDSGQVNNQWSQHIKQYDGSVTHSKFVPGPLLLHVVEDLQDVELLDLSSPGFSKPMIAVSGDSSFDEYAVLCKLLAPCICVVDETDAMASQFNYHPFIRELVNRGAHMEGMFQHLETFKNSDKYGKGEVLVETIGNHGVFGFRRTTAIHSDIANKTDTWVCVQMSEGDLPHIKKFISARKDIQKQITTLDNPIIHRYDNVEIFSVIVDNDDIVDKSPNTPFIKRFY